MVCRAYIYTYSKVELLLTAEIYPPNHILSYAHVLKYTDYNVL